MRACEENCEPIPRPKPQQNSVYVKLRKKLEKQFGVYFCSGCCLLLQYLIQNCSHVVFITAVPITKLFVWCGCVFITAGPIIKLWEPSWSAFWLQKPSILRVCVREEDAGGREAGAHSTTPTYTAGKCCVYYCSTYYKGVRVCVGGNNGGHS
jgi:hypothetical protein